MCFQYSVSTTVSLINWFGVKTKFKPIWGWRDTLFTICPLFEFITKIRVCVSEIGSIFGFRWVVYERKPILLPPPPCQEKYTQTIFRHFLVSLYRVIVSCIIINGLNGEWTDHVLFWEAEHCHKEVVSISRLTLDIEKYSDTFVLYYYVCDGPIARRC